MGIHKERILGVFAHADDEAICGWPVMQNQDAERFLLTVCDKNERLSDILDNLCRGQGIERVRHKGNFEPRFSLSRTGSETVTIARLIAEAVREIKPDKVVTHNEWGEYGHPDHILLSQLVRNYTTVPVVTSNIEIPSMVWLKPKVLAPVYPSGFEGVDRNEGFWNAAKGAYGDLWTTNAYINNGCCRSAMVRRAEPDKGPTTLIHNLVVWLCDTKGWAFNNQAAALAGELHGYAHRVVYLKPDPVKRAYFYSEKDRPDMERADVVVAMTPAAVQFMPQRANVVTRISGVRSV